MRSSIASRHTLVAAAILVTACGGGGSAGTPAPGANVTATFPNLFDQSGSKVLATYISHVITSQKYPLASIAVQNTGPAATLQVSVDLPSYGSSQTQTLSLAEGQSQTVTLSPTINYTQLFSLTTAVPAALNVSVTAGSSTLFQQSYPIEISGRDTVFWSNNNQSTAGLIATMVTPTDKANAITTLLRNAAPGFPGGMLVGYQGGAWPSTSTGAIVPGSYVQRPLEVLQGESVTVTIDSVVNGLSGSDVATVFIIDDTNFQAWLAGSPTATMCALNTSATAGTVVTCATPTANTFYHVVYYNPSGNLTLRTVAWHGPMTQWEVTYYQTQAIFQQLRSQGFAYLNLPGTGFFSASQNIMYPSESLAALSANCIEGSLVFASAWERMGMEPMLAIDFTHGHAFTAVRCWAGTTGCVIPVETTMVGGTATFADAVNTASANWAGWASTLQILDIKAARALGLTPAPM